jgi:hypothetical protein
MYARGKEIPEPHTAIRLFDLCSHMKWALLPEPGGLYAQDSSLLEKFRIIFSELDAEAARQNQNTKNQVNAQDHLPAL